LKDHAIALLTELANLLLNDVVIPEKIKPDGEPGSVRLWGKGRKERICTLNWKGLSGGGRLQEAARRLERSAPVSE
jgi:hypothetical protein